ncbi:MAG: hypothetical protein LBD90_09460, partial [Bifidobacteriaceae bacterium]|nr:hypothetical protein [Bifidobacteriaceae bacterium]
MTRRRAERTGAPEVRIPQPGRLRRYAASHPRLMDWSAAGWLALACLIDLAPGADQSAGFGVSRPAAEDQVVPLVQPLLADGGGRVWAVVIIGLGGALLVGLL